MNRPEGVPEGAQWMADEKRWESGPAPSGVRHGAFTYWRADGTKQAEVRFKEGKRHGPFREYDASGEVAREGNYRNDELHGTTSWRRMEGAPSEPPPDGAHRSLNESLSNGVSAAVWRTEVEFDMGRALAVRHFAKDGRRILADGTALPAQPKGVPSLAEYDVESGRWFHGQKTESGERTGLWMWWTKDGTLVEEAEFRAGDRQGTTRRYNEAGVLLEDGSYAEGKKTGPWSTYDEKDGALLKKIDYDEGELHGSYIEFGPDGRSKVRIEYEYGKKSGPFLARIEKDKYRGGKIRVEKGHYKDDAPVGRWKLLDKNLKPVFTVDFGVPRIDEQAVAASDVFLDEERPADFWRGLADSFFEERIIGEGVLAMARAAAAAKDGRLLTEVLDERLAPLSDEAAAELANLVLGDSGDQLHALVGALVQGADAAEMLEALAITLDRRGKPTAARDFIDAAIHASPKNRSLHYTRALVSISLGESDDALADAAALADDQPESARFLTSYVRALFPRYDFWPARIAIEGPRSPLTLVRDGDAVQGAMQRYATRFEAVRRRLLQRSPGIMSWAPPDAAPLLPGGAVQLQRNDDVDELLDVNGLDLPRLLTLARANWAALGWLAFAVGLRRPALPRRLEPPADLGRAAAMARARHRAAKQKMVPGGAPPTSFVWEETDLLAMSPHLVEVCLAEWREADRALRWATDVSVRSPFATSFPEP